jgi:radical SAM superfamily enzyme YgiQ (UPF0313 family)
MPNPISGQNISLLNLLKAFSQSMSKQENKPMRITFVYKGRYQVRDAKTLEYCSAIAKSNQHSSRLVWDQDIFGVTDNVFHVDFLNKIFSKKGKIISQILGKKPDWVVLFDGLCRQNWNIRIADLLKKTDSNIKIILLSYWLNEDSLYLFDKVLIGDPETTFRKFFEKKQDQTDQKVFKTEKVDKLDLLPLPDADLFGPKINIGDSYLIYTSKGCPYNCSYCEESVYSDAFGKEYFRQMSPGRVIKELKVVKQRFKIKEVIFKDSVFSSNKEWVLKFLDHYRQSINIPFKCFAKAECFDRQIAKALIESKCYCVEFGVQTFNQKIKKEILNRHENNESLTRCFDICDELGLNYDIDHLFGIPGETVADHIRAAGIYASLKKLNRIKCHNMVYYKKARIYDFAPDLIRQNKDYEADFFSGIAGSREMKQANRIFQKYFKILPLLSKEHNQYFLGNKRWIRFRLVPSFIILLLMLVLAFKNRDKRFWVYLRYYPKKIINALSG